MPWVAIEVLIASDPAVHRIAAQLHVRVPEAVGLLTLAFAGMVQHAPDGQVGAVPDTLLEEWARWHGKRGQFAEQFRAELADEAGLVTAWEKYNGANLRRLETARERARQWRENQDRERNVRAAERIQNANGTHSDTRSRTRTEQGTERIPYASTEQNRTEQNHQQQERGAKTPRRAPPPWVVRLADHWISRVGSVSAANVKKHLAKPVEQRGEEAILRAMDAWLDARNGAGKDPVLKWFAEVAVAYADRVDTPVVDPATGIPTERGMKILAGTGA